MNLTSFLENGKLTIELIGEIDHHCANKYIAVITAKIEAYSPKKCVLDFREVRFMDSSGIAVVINTIRLMKKMNGEVSLSGLSDQPLKVFKTSGIDKLVNILEVVT